MKTKKIEIQETCRNTRDGVMMLTKIIDNQINNCKLKFQSDWEKDHSLSLDNLTKKVDGLEQQKKEILAFLNGTHNGDTKVNLKLNFEIELEDQNQFGAFSGKIAV